MEKIKILIHFLLILSGANGNDDTCEMNACEALEQSQIDLREFADSLEENNTKSYLIRLERRLRSLEQPGR
ncbi:hypothetical protein NQ314_018442 [Rhamnusium bicolor]|uniref:Uncharacterized protein n=1 Tax=Rhamnusium bicolor TaxID=1586634 RepID=A0AAV8WQZ8_9CUCU|nr:hypothetical protein NQ314_018442 [Rhamnusium bicolor]